MICCLFPYARCWICLERVSQSGTLLNHICTVLELTFANNLEYIRMARCWFPYALCGFDLEGLRMVVGLIYLEKIVWARCQS